MDHLARLEKVIEKVNLALKKNEQVKTEYATLKEENNQLQKLLKERNAKVEELENQMKMLKLAKQVSLSGTGEKTELKRKINEFIKEIDKCVALLNN